MGHTGCLFWFDLPKEKLQPTSFAANRIWIHIAICLHEYALRWCVLGAVRNLATCAHVWMQKGEDVTRHGVLANSGRSCSATVFEVLRVCNNVRISTV